MLPPCKTMPELNLVKRTEYEKLMAQIKQEHKQFKPVFETTLEVVTDIIFAYGHIQKKIPVPDRPMTLEEFLVLNKNNCSFIELPAKYADFDDKNFYANYLNLIAGPFRRWIGKLVAESWSWQDQRILIKMFVRLLHKQLNYFIKNFSKERFFSDLVGDYVGHSSYLFCIVPPNLKELLEQVLEHRKQNTKTKKEVAE